MPNLKRPEKSLLGFRQAMDRAHPTRLRFGPFEADLVRKELYENGELVPIQGKPFQFLAMVLRHYGDTVSREAMSHALWPDIYVQVNQGLNAAARKVRMALRDVAHKSIYIQTLGSKGYRFIHPVEVMRWSSDVTEIPDPCVRILVLPLRSNSPEEAILAEGLTAELTAKLGRIHAKLTVLPGWPIEQHISLNGDLEARLRLAQVQYVLSGAFSLRAGRSELALNLTTVADGHSLWSHRYEAASHAIPEVLVQVADRVLQSFPKLTSVAAAPAIRTKYSVYQEYLAGRHHQLRRTVASYRDAVNCYKKASERDPEFAPAYLGLSEAFNFIAVRGWMTPRDAYDQAQQAAKRALELDPTNPDAMIALGWSHLAGARDWAMATRLFERALQSNPNSTLGYCYYSYLLFTRGRADDGVAALEKARGIDPASLFINSRLAAMYYFARRYDEAIKQARSALAISRDCPYSRAYLGLSYLVQRRHGEALNELQAAVEHSHGDSITVAQLAYAQAQAGRFPEAEALLQKLQTSNGQSVPPAYHLALIKLALGDVNEAFQWLDTAYRQCWHWVLLTPHDPRLDILRGTRRFETLCRSMRPAEAKKIVNSSN